MTKVGQRRLAGGSPKAVEKFFRRLPIGLIFKLTL
jgi:hypothetical protein